MPRGLSRQKQREIRTAIAANRRPTRGPSNRTILATGAGEEGRNKYVVLADASARLTPAGRFYYQQTGERKPNAAFDRSQQPVNRGPNTFIRTRDNREALVRSYRPDGSVRVTALGEAFYRDRFSEHVVHVPVKIVGKRSNGNFYSRPDWLPVDQLGINSIMESDRFTPEQAHARVRTRVLEELGLRTEGGATVLMEVSGETFLYDRSRADEWQISTLSTVVNARGQADTNVALRRPMAGLRSCAAMLPYSDQILPEAFLETDDKLCVPRQLAALLGKPLAAVVDTFTALLDGEEWQQQGITAEQLKAYAVAEGHPFFFAVGNRLVLAYEPTAKQGKAIAAAMHDGHCYMYRSARGLANWHLRETAASSRVKLQQEAKCCLPPLAEWQEWDRRPRPGQFWCSDLQAARRWFLQSGRSPRVVLRSMVELSSLSYVCNETTDGCAGVCKLRELPPEAESIQAWLRRLPRDIEYRGERLPAITARVFLELLRAERRTPPASERQRLLKEQDHRCALCAGVFDDDVEWDHAQPLQQQVKGKEQSFQAVCASCHAEKTALEGKQDRTLESRFSAHAWENYVLSPRPPPLVFEAHKLDEDQQLLEIDVRRCRRNALAKSPYPWPIFCPYDSIRPAVPGELCDFSYVSLAQGRRSRLSVLPYLGPAWMARPAVEWMLHVGLCTWADILYSLQATAHVPPECLEEPLKVMQEAWGEEQHLAKLSVNAMVGLWASDTQHTYSVRTSNSEEDCQGYHMKRLVSYEGGSVMDYIYATRLVGNASWRPVHDYIMALEHTRVSQLRFILARLKVPPRAIRQVKTDCVVLQGFAQKHLPALKEISGLQHGELPRLQQKYAKVEPGQQRLHEVYPMTPGRPDEDPVYRWTDEGVKPLQGFYREPKLEVPEPPPAPDWQDLPDADQALDAARREGLFIAGCPGTGKSFFARQLVQQLREAGSVVHCIAKTHNACKNFGHGCVTADHWCIKYVRNADVTCDYLFVEEVSQIDVQLWCDIVLAKMRGVRVVAIGDWGQFDAIAQSWAGCPVERGSLERSDMIRELTHGNRYELVENQRSDPLLFDFITSLRPGLPAERPLPEALADARRRYPATDRAPDWVLVLSHRKRVALNRRLNQAKKPKEGAVFLRHRPAQRCQAGGNQPQSMWLWPGCQLIGQGGPCPKGVLVQVEEASPEQVKLSNGAALTAEQAMKCCRLAHALCYASVQGLTLPGVVRMEDCDNPLFTLRHLYVGCSRATAHDLLEVA